MLGVRLQQADERQRVQLVHGQLRRGLRRRRQRRASLGPALATGGARLGLAQPARGSAVPCSSSCGRRRRRRRRRGRCPGCVRVRGRICLSMLFSVTVLLLLCLVLTLGPLISVRVLLRRERPGRPTP